MKGFALAAALLTAPTAQALTFKPAPNRPYVQSGAEGAFYARCVPAGESGWAGTTTVYRVGRDKDEVVDTYDWYAKDGVTLGWSPAAGKVAVAARGGKPTKDGPAALSSHLGGKEVAAYTAEDLKAWGAAADPVLARVGKESVVFRVVGSEQVPGTNDYDFVVEVGGKQVRFDVLTGKRR